MLRPWGPTTLVLSRCHDGHRPGAPGCRLLWQLLKGPTVAVRVAEWRVQNPPEVLDLADFHPAAGELRARRVDVRDDQVQTLDGTRRRADDTRAHGDRATAARLRAASRRPCASAARRGGIPPCRYQTLKPHMLWCCRKLRDLA